MNDKHLIILRTINQSRYRYTSFTNIYEKASLLVSRTELYEGLDCLVRSGYIRIKGISTELYIGITGAGIRFLVKMV